MPNLFTTFLVFGFCAIVGCKTSGKQSALKDYSDSNSTDNNWEEIMTCAGGDARVDIDTNERRNFQLILTNKYMFSKFDKIEWTYNQIKNENERIYRGQAIDGRGVFRHEDFKGFFANGVSDDRRGFKVKMKITNKTSLVFTAVNLTECGGELRDNDFPSSCTVDEYVFNGCELKN